MKPFESDDKRVWQKGLPPPGFKHSKYTLGPIGFKWGEKILRVRAMMVESDKALSILEKFVDHRYHV